MKRTILLGLATAVLAAVNIPAANAGHTTSSCVGSVVSVNASGNNEGFLSGVIVGAATERVGIRCYVTVNGVEVSSTPTSFGLGMAVTAGRVSFFGSGFARLCREIHHSHGSDTRCGNFPVV